MKSRQARLLNLLIQDTVDQDQLPSPHQSFNRSSKANLFMEYPPQRMAISLNNSKSYEFVGVKQLKAYCDRMRGGKNHSKKFTSSRGMGSFTSNIKAKDDQQLITRVQLLNMKQNSLQNTIQHFSIQDSSQKTNYVFSSLHNQPRKSSNSNFSLKKIKSNHKAYVQNWTKTETSQQKQKGYPSLLRLTTQAREQYQQKQNNSIKQLKQNMKQSEWQQNLRQKNTLSQFYQGKQSKQTKIKRNLLTLLGKNKIKEETEWVNQKGDKGCRFKFIQQHISV